MVSDHPVAGGRLVVFGLYYNWECMYLYSRRYRLLCYEEVARDHDRDDRDHLGLGIWIGDQVGLTFRHHRRNL